MSIIGFDFGSHNGSIALWFEEKNTVEVIADDLGSRTIPCAVAFRGSEVIVGQAAMAQQHKNPLNTFDDIRGILMGSELTVHVPVLEKEITVQELASHFFRNIHNQIKQQVGKVVRESIISLPTEMTEEAKARLFEAAQAGGIRIKYAIDDAASTLLAYGLDDESLAAATVVVIDIGWSKTVVSIFSVSGGLFVPVSSQSSEEMSGKVIVRLLSEHCAKDFQRKAKFPCIDNSRAMMRLRRQCEDAIKHLSTGAEATIDIDSLCEGVDYSSKISRARFEDLVSIPLVSMKKLIGETVSSASLTQDVSHVCLAGGLAAMPKVLSIVKGMFDSAIYPRIRVEPSEVQCVGACLQGKYLFQQVTCWFCIVCFVNLRFSNRACLTVHPSALVQ